MHQSDPHKVFVAGFLAGARFEHDSAVGTVLLHLRETSPEVRATLVAALKAVGMDGLAEEGSREASTADDAENAWDAHVSD